MRWGVPNDSGRPVHSGYCYCRSILSFRAVSMLSPVQSVHRFGGCSLSPTTVQGETAMRNTVRFALAAATLLLAAACSRTSPDVLLPSGAPSFDGAPADTTSSTSRG